MNTDFVSTEVTPPMIPDDALTGRAAGERSTWSAIFAIALGVAGLIIAEFLPAGMLTPMARDLGITEGMAGQAVTATSIFAVLTSLLLAFATRKLNRRHVLLSLSILLVGSNFLVAYASSFPILLAGRVLLGIALGGFWSMAAATAARLVNLPGAQLLLPLLLSVAGLGFLVFGTSVSATAVLIFVWGALMGPISVLWSAWVTRRVPEHAEIAGGVFVAAIQLSAAVGALLGGTVFDSFGSAGVFSLSAVSWLLSAVMVGGFVKTLAMGARVSAHAVH